MREDVDMEERARRWETMLSARPGASLTGLGAAGVAGVAGPGEYLKALWSRLMRLLDGAGRAPPGRAMRLSRSSAR